MVIECSPTFSNSLTSRAGGACGLLLLLLLLFAIVVESVLLLCVWCLIAWMAMGAVCVPAVLALLGVYVMGVMLEGLSCVVLAVLSGLLLTVRSIAFGVYVYRACCVIILGVLKYFFTLVLWVYCSGHAVYCLLSIII